MPQAKKAAARPTYKITDRTDRELLGVIADVGGDNGGATANAIAEALGIDTGADKKMTPGKVIAPRLGAMRTVGLLERRVEKITDQEGQPFTTHVWTLTDKGAQIMNGKLAKAVDAALVRLDPGQRILVMQSVMKGGYREGDRTTALALRRQSQYELAQRKVPFRVK